MLPPLHRVCCCYSEKMYDIPYHYSSGDCLGLWKEEGDQGEVGQGSK